MESLYEDITKKFSDIFNKTLRINAEDKGNIKMIKGYTSEGKILIQIVIFANNNFSILYEYLDKAKTIYWYGPTDLDKAERTFKAISMELLLS